VIALIDCARCWVRPLCLLPSLQMGLEGLLGLLKAAAARARPVQSSLPVAVSPAPGAAASGPLPSPPPTSTASASRAAAPAGGTEYLSDCRVRLHRDALGPRTRWLIDANAVLNAWIPTDTEFFLRPNYVELHHRTCLLAQWFSETGIPAVWLFDGSAGAAKHAEVLRRRAMHAHALSEMSDVLTGALSADEAEIGSVYQKVAAARRSLRWFYAQPGRGPAVGSIVQCLHEADFDLAVYGQDPHSIIVSLDTDFFVVRCACTRPPPSHLRTGTDVRRCICWFVRLQVSGVRYLWFGSIALNGGILRIEAGNRFPDLPPDQKVAFAYGTPVPCPSSAFAAVSHIRFRVYVCADVACPVWW
jgi:hypothetical protein